MRCFTRPIQRAPFMKGILLFIRRAKTAGFLQLAEQDMGAEGAAFFRAEINGRPDVSK